EAASDFTTLATSCQTPQLGWNGEGRSRRGTIHCESHIATSRIRGHSASPTCSDNCPNSSPPGLGPPCRSAHAALAHSDKPSGSVYRPLEFNVPGSHLVTRSASSEASNTCGMGVSVNKFVNRSPLAEYINRRTASLAIGWPTSAMRLII